MIPSQKSTDVEGQLYALIYTILYRGVEHPQILVSAAVVGGPGTHSPQIPRNNLSFGEVKSYAWVFDHTEVVPLTPALFKVSYTYTMEYYSQIKMNRLELHVSTWTSKTKEKEGAERYIQNDTFKRSLKDAI